MTKEHRTRWTPDEKARLAQAALPLLLADAKCSVIESVRRVQNTVLPQERQRTLANIGSLPNELRTTLEQRRKAARGEATLVPAEEGRRLNHELEQARAEAERLTQELSSLQAHIRTLEAVPKPPSAAEAVQDFIAEIIAQALVRSRAVPGVRVGPVKAPPPLPPRHDPAPPLAEANKSRLPTVLICGLKPPQRSPIESAFNGRVRCKFWHDGDQNLHSVADKAHNAEMVFLVMAATSHKLVEKIQTVTDRFQRVPGGGSTLKATIESWLERREHESGARS